METQGEDEKGQEMDGEKGKERKEERMGVEGSIEERN